MSFTYNVAALGTALNKIRRLVGDTKQEKHKLEDEEITDIYTEEGSNVYRAAAALCIILAAEYAKTEEIRMSGMTSRKSAVSAKYLELAKKYRRRAQVGATFVAPCMSISDMDAHEEASDEPQPSFYKGMMKHPEGDSDPDDLTYDTTDD